MLCDDQSDLGQRADGGLVDHGSVVQLETQPRPTPGETRDVVRAADRGQDLLSRGYVASAGTGVEPSSIRRLTCNAR